MTDDILAGIFGQALSARLGGSRRAELVARLFFGLLGTGLLAFGGVHFALRDDLAVGSAVHASMVAAFFFLACFSLFNVALARRWRWPGRLSLLSLVALFVARILLGP